MGYKVIFTAQADRDLEKIVHFLASKNPSAARRLGHALLDMHLLWRSCRGAGWPFQVAPNIDASCIGRGS